MSRTLTASDRSSLIRLASSLPVGSPDRVAALALDTKAASDRMELFEEIEGQIARLRNHPDWKDVRGKIDDALQILGRDEPSAEMEEAFDQMMIAQRAQDKAIQQLRMW